MVRTGSCHAYTSATVLPVSTEIVRATDPRVTSPVNVSDFSSVAVVKREAVAVAVTVTALPTTTSAAVPDRSLKPEASDTAPSRNAGEGELEGWIKASIAVAIVGLGIAAWIVARRSPR